MSGGEGPAPAWSRGERSETHVPSSAAVGERRSLGYRQRSHVRCPVQGQVAGDEDGMGEGEGEGRRRKPLGEAGARSPWASAPWTQAGLSPRLVRVMQPPERGTVWLASLLRTGWEEGKSN